MAEEKLDDVAWCERCLRPFDRPKPTSPFRGWRVCDECKTARRSEHNKLGARPRRARAKAAQEGR